MWKEKWLVSPSIDILIRFLSVLSMSYVFVMYLLIPTSWNLSLKLDDRKSENILWLKESFGIYATLYLLRLWSPYCLTKYSFVVHLSSNPYTPLLKLRRPCIWSLIVKSDFNSTSSKDSCAQRFEYRLEMQRSLKSPFSSLSLSPETCVFVSRYLDRSYLLCIKIAM